MFVDYVRADLLRNPRRTLSTMVGVMLGVGLSCAVLFFVDGLSASMTQRAVAPLPLDMQRVLTQPVAADLRLTQETDVTGSVDSGDVVTVGLEMHNEGQTPANEVVVRSEPPPGFEFVPGSARLDGNEVGVEGQNPLARGPAKAGLNLGTLSAGTARVLEYEIRATESVELDSSAVPSTYSTRESLTPTAANAGDPTDLDGLVSEIEAVDGVAFADQLSFADLPPGALTTTSAVDGAVRVFGFDTTYGDRDPSVDVIDGAQTPGEALLSAEAASSVSVGVGDTVDVSLPDDSTLTVKVSGIVDLTRARSLFSSRQGADLETFAYVPNSIVVDSATFAEAVLPAFERARADRRDLVKSPPVREVDIGVERDLLDADPGTALEQTRSIATDISSIAGQQDFLLDNISNTLEVARADAAVAKRLFVFLGVPGALLAAMLAAYAGSVLAGAQRREQATLRIRGASRSDLLSMLALRVSCITAGGAIVGVVLGYASAAAVVGHDTLMRATTASLVLSAVLGTAAGLLATGAALYLSGRRSIDREINEDRSRLVMRPPAWRRYRLDLIGVLAVTAATVAVVAAAGFEGTPGSVYVARSVRLPLWLLFLPIGAWIAGSLLAGRTFAWALTRSRRRSPDAFRRPLRLLYRLSIRRRAWSVANAAVVVALIVALGTSLAVFTTSYDSAKAADARFVVGSDVRIAPSPDAEPASAEDAATYTVGGIEQVAPVVYGVHNVVIRSTRTSEVANMAALDPTAYEGVAPLDDSHFSSGSAAAALMTIREQPTAVLLSQDMADFLQAEVGDHLQVLLARGSDEQVETEMELVGLFERLPGFPDGADALMNIDHHEEMFTSTAPDFFLGRTGNQSSAALDAATGALRAGPGSSDALQIDTRDTALARDQSSLAALNISGLLDLDSAYALAMGTVTIAIFVFGLLLQRRREYVTLRAQGFPPGAIRMLISAEAGTVAVAGCVSGVLVGLVMAWFFINVLRPLFVLTPTLRVSTGSTLAVVASVLLATVITSVAASSLVNRLQATELLRDE